jgi:CO/xanthine dehydrogenase Mo-binding subunit
VFAAESFVDEIASALAADPLAFRLAHLADARGRAVLERAAAGAGWGTPLAGEARARGIGYARYKNTGAWCAVVARVEVDTQVRVRKLTIAVDAGTVVNPDGLVNQIEGGAIQATSWALKEALPFDANRVLADSWEHYPILGFAEVPEVDVLVVEPPGEPSLGAGEASLGPTAAAIGNAVFAAIGVRVRALPITPQRIVDAMP